MLQMSVPILCGVGKGLNAGRWGGMVLLFVCRIFFLIYVREERMSGRWKRCGVATADGRGGEVGMRL